MSFKNFQFHDQIQTAIESCGYVSPTPIQEQAIVPVLQGRDLMGLAQTGTGKTAAFVLPILQRLCSGPKNRVRALIISPTRELAEQTHSYIGKLSRGTNVRSVVVTAVSANRPRSTKSKEVWRLLLPVPVACSTWSTTGRLTFPLWRCSSLMRPTTCSTRAFCLISGVSEAICRNSARTWFFPQPCRKRSAPSSRTY